MSGPKLAAPVLHPGQHPERRSLPLAHWPMRDRQAWSDILAPGDVLDPGGAGAAWAPATRRMIQAGYGQWLAWLQRTGGLEADTVPAERVTLALLTRHIVTLEARVASRSVLAYVEAVADFCRAAAPEADWTWLMRLLGRLKRRAVPVQGKRHRVVPTPALLALGQRVMHNAEATPDPAPWRTARRYRDGLMVALLALRPLRLRNFTDIEIGRHLLRRHDGGYLLRFTAAETKARRRLEFAVPKDLVPPLERYLSHHRPQLCARAALRSTAKGAPRRCGYGCRAKDRR